jgi:hypothetical protein
VGIDEDVIKLVNWLVQDKGATTTPTIGVISEIDCKGKTTLAPREPQLTSSSQLESDPGSSKNKRKLEVGLSPHVTVVTRYEFIVRTSWPGYIIISYLLAVVKY